jgi:hypothetical protein
MYAEECRHGLDPAWCSLCKQTQGQPPARVSAGTAPKSTRRSPARSKATPTGEDGAEGPRKQRLILTLEAALNEPLHRASGTKSVRYQTSSGRPVLIKYACGHDRTSTTTFFVGVPLDTHPDTIIAIAFGDSDDDVFLPARQITDHGDHISKDGATWKPYLFRDATGDLIFRIASLRRDIRLQKYIDPFEAIRQINGR